MVAVYEPPRAQVFRTAGYPGKRVQSAEVVTFLFSSNGRKVEFGSDYMENVEMLATTADLEKLQPVELVRGVISVLPS